MAVSTYVWKIASRCNLNCDYCYVYNAGDDLWRSQPKLMSKDVASSAAYRIRHHAQASGISSVEINFHGGEPFLGGVRHLAELHDTITDVFDGSGVSVDTALQTNGLLFTREIGDFLADRRIALHVSVDGPPEVNDLHRVDVRGRPTGEALDEKLDLITSYRGIFAGFLTVVDPRTRPERVIDYLAQYRPPTVDFLLPLNNHDQPPPLGVDMFARWLCQAFDYVMDLDAPLRVRTFDDIMLRLLGKSDDSDADYLIVETDGSLELDDTLKTARPGYPRLGYSVFDDDLDDVASDIRVQSLRNEVRRLSAECQRCPLVAACRGGHVSHRFSTDRDLLNPSVYCAALQELILHIRHRLMLDMQSLVARRGA